MLLNGGSTRSPRTGMPIVSAGSPSVLRPKTLSSFIEYDENATWERTRGPL